MKTRGILFDLDGTLVDSEKYYTEGTYAWLKKAGYKGKLSDVYPIIGKTMPETYAYLHELYPVLSKAEIIEKNTTYFYRDHPISYGELLFPEVKEVLRELVQQGYHLALCSLSGPQEVSSFLKQSGLSSYFSCVLNAADCIQHKPNPEIWLTAMKKMCLSPEEVVIVEDSCAGILSAKRAQALTWARRDERFHTDQHLADYLFDHLQELVMWLKEREHE